MLGLETRRPRSASLRRPGALACVLGFALLASCAPASQLDTTPRPATAIVVHNYSGDYTTVYLGRRGSMWRLGEIEGRGDATFPVPRAAFADAEDVYLVARRLAGPTFRSESFPLPSGTTAVWTIEGQPSLSHVALR